MNFWGWICDMLATTPEEDARHDELMIEYGIEEPIPAMEWEDTQNYLDHMPTERDVWYDGEFTGYYQLYKTDHSGHRWYEPEAHSFYTGYQGRVEPDEVVFGELVVDELYQLYELMKGTNDEH